MISALRRYAGLTVPYRRTLSAGALLAVLVTALSLATPWPLKIIVDDVLRPKAGTPHLLGVTGVRPVLAVAITTLLLVVLASGAADYLSTRLMETAGQRIGNDLRARLYQHLQRLSLRFHGGQMVGDLSARATADVDRVQDMLVQLLSVLLPNMLLLVGMVTVMFVVDPQFALLALVSSPFMAAAIFRATRRMKSASRTARKADGQVAAAVTETLSAIALVQAFNLEGRQSDRFDRLTDVSLRASVAAIREQALLSPVVDVAGAVATAALLWFGSLRVLQGDMRLGTLLVFLTYVATLYKPIRALAKLSYVVSRGTVCAERISALLDEAPEVASEAGALAVERAAGAIALENVSFGYGREAVLKDINLSVQPGEIVALVGPTGAGKSTLAALVPRFYDPDDGRVTLDGVDLRRYDVKALRRQIGLVMQDTTLFHGSLFDNIAVGLPNASPKQVMRAAEVALVDEFADRLPDGYGTMLGERATNLSGGQRQRVAIARAVLRDAPVLILDEPTSALDANSEQLVMDALRNLIVGRTTLIIAHRLSTVLMADRVVVLADGRIVEQGPPAALRKSGGLFADLWAAQQPTAAPRAKRVPVAGGRHG